jgi:hypothetical protein
MQEDIPPVLNGTWPVRAHADRFFGTVKADGQHPRVAGLVCYKGEVIAISLVGYDSSTSAALANLWLCESVAFTPDGVKWDGPRYLKRRQDAYKQFSVQLEGTKEMHYIAIPSSAHLAEGILHPPDLLVKEKTVAAEQKPADSPITRPTADRSRFVFGNWNEDYPHQRSFLGTLYGLRVLFLHRDAEHPEWPAIWAKEMWKRGLARKLIQPIREALGMKAWVVSGDLEAWGKLVGDGARAGWLPWKATISEREEEDAHIHLAEEQDAARSP